MVEALPRARVLSPEGLVDPTARVTRSTLGEWTWIGPNSSITESRFGDYSYTAGDVAIIYSDVGKFCSIASHARLNPGNHPMERVTQHHMTYRRVEYGLGEEDDDEFFAWRRAHKVTVGHDVWIGHGAILLPGVSVGTGAVIGAGAVVTKDVAPYMIAAGVPAKPLRPRFEPRVARRLLQIAWWDWPRDAIESRFNDFTNLDAFIDKYG